MLLDVGGQDATEAFEDVGHSDEAREILDGLLIGPLKRLVRHTLSNLEPHPLLLRYNAPTGRNAIYFSVVLK